MSKRLFDLAVALPVLLLCLPLFAVVALLIKADSRGPVFFRQERLGRNFRPFRILKFRTMRADAAGATITVGADARITRVGRWLRAAKIDELPQLINVVRGEMSLVGPRPEMREYVELFRNDYEELLAVRPGITDPASLEYRNESALLAQMPDPARAYVQTILPDKIRLGKLYVRNRSVFYDLQLICRTMIAILRPHGSK